MTDFRGTAGNEGEGFVVADGISLSSTAITFDPPSLATGAFAVSTAIAVTGVALGDALTLYPPYDTQGVIYQASVSSAGNIKISLFNANTSTVDLASGTWRVAISRAV